MCSILDAGIVKLISCQTAAKYILMRVVDFTYSWQIKDYKQSFCLDYLGIILPFAVISEHRIYWGKITITLKSGGLKAPVILEKCESKVVARE